MTHTLTIPIDNDPRVELKRSLVMAALDRLLIDVADPNDADITRLLVQDNLQVGIVVDGILASPIAKTVKQLKQEAGGK